jgi:F5/8 type C domain
MCRALLTLLACVGLNVAMTANTAASSTSAPISWRDATATASSAADGFGPGGATNGNRFAFSAGDAWKPAEAQGWWQVQFRTPKTVGSILQIVGDHAFVFQSAPSESEWQASDDGARWRDLPSTHTSGDRRLFRIHRLPKPVRAKYFRFLVNATTGAKPTLREVEFYASPMAVIPFPDWAVVVNATDSSALPGHGTDFIPLARSCAGYESLQAQQVWLDAFNEDFLRVEPRPLCVFMSGTFKDWCQIDREPWRGAQGVLKAGRTPIWASCGSAQALALLDTVGVDHPWDCPHCRNAANPKSPIYGHIGHLHPGQPHACGDYSDCIFERGPHAVLKTAPDPAFAGLGDAFKVIESHCGQIEEPPPGWKLIVTAGPGTSTKVQCMRRENQPVYAAQFHIEMPGEPASSRIIAANFLALAQRWNAKESHDVRRR